MANFDISFDRLMKLEFSSPKNALHKNQGENGYTFMGIYEVANPKWSGWEQIKNTLSLYPMEYASEVLFNDRDLKEQVKDFYKKQYWDKAKLDYVLPFDTANLIFIFGVNAGMKTAIKYAQQVVNVENDGIVGNITLRALNAYSPLKFVSEYKSLQVKYYTQLAHLKPSYKAFLNGWLNRVKNS